ncbi:MAG: SIMPL domain-containing protein [Gloeocapsa sp. DLM2.Bin57]|nr:MAG: SIMPL domain-containing protein [Gloeocapsa sp. DLM2.Bin57]
MKDSQPFPQLLAGLTILSLSLVISSWIATTGLKTIRRADDVLVVTGSAKQPITSDYIIWRFSVSTQQQDPQSAYQDLMRQTAILRAYLKTQQVPDEVITVSAIESYSIPEVDYNGRETGEILAYRLTQRFEIRSSDVDKYTDLSQTSSELLAQGINLYSESPQYLYTQLDQLRVEMVAEATKDAKARAEAIAESTGIEVGSLRAARTGVFQITSRNSTDVSDYGIYDTSSVEKDITAVVSVTLAIK